MRVGEAMFRAVADFSGIDQEAQRAGRALGNMEADAGAAGAKTGSKFVSAFKVGLGLLTAAGGIAGALFTGKAMTAGMNRLTTIQDSTASLTQSFQSASKAGSFMEEILKVVSGTPFNLDQFAQAGSMMVGFGVDAKKVPGYLTAIGETSARMGEGAGDAAARISKAFGQVTTSGKISTDLINTLAETGTNGMVILANAFGVTTEEMAKMVSKGAVPASEGLDILTKGIMEGSTGVAGETLKMAGTMEGLRETMSGAKGGFSAAIARFGANVISPFVGAITKGYQGAADVLDTLGKTINKGLQAVVDSPAGQALMVWLQDLPTKIVAAFGVIGRLGGLLAPVLTEISGAFTALGAAFREGGTDITSAGLPGIFEGIGLAARIVWDAVQPLKNLVLNASADGFARVEEIFNQLASIAANLLPAIVSIATSLGEATAKVSAVVWTVFLNVLESVASILEAVLVPALQLLADYMEENESLVQGLVGGYAAYSAVQSAIDWATEIWGLIQTGIGWVQNAIAIGAATIAKVKDAAATAYLVALYAKDAVVKAASTVATWASVAASKAMAVAQALTSAATYRAAAAWVASRAVMIAGAVATGAVTAAQWLLNAALTANPIGLIIMLIAGLVAAFVLLWQNNEGFRNFFIGMWEGIKTAAAAVADWFTGTLVPAFIAAVDWIVAAWGGIVQWFTDLWSSIVQTVQIFILAFQLAWGQVVSFMAGVWEAIVAGVTAFVDGFVTVFQSVVSFLQPVLDVIAAAFGAWLAIVEFVITLVVFLVMSVVMWFVNMAQQIMAALTAAWNSVVMIWSMIVSWLTTMVGVLVAVVVAKWNEMKAFITAVLGAIWAVVSSIWNRIVSYVTMVAGLVWSIVSSKFEQMRATVAAVLGAIWTAVSAKWNQVVAFVTTAAGLIWSVVSSKFNQVLSTVTGILGMVWAVISGKWNEIVAYVTMAAGLVWSVVSGKFNEIWSTVSSIMALIGAAISVAWSGIVATVTGAAQQVWNAVSTKFNEVVSFVGGFGASIVATIGNTGTLLWNAGASIISGLLGGLKSAFDGVKGFFTDLTSKIPDWKGPKKHDAVMLENAGQLILGGFLRGLESMYGGVKNSLGDFTDGLSMDVDVPVEFDFRPPGPGDLPGFSASAMLGGFQPTYTTEAVAGDVSSRTVVNEKPGDTFLVDKIEVNNPEPETASDSLPKAVRKLATVGVRTA